jgi:AcrR family transcriptional regulator
MKTKSAPVTARPLREDARRNRERVLAAAKAAFEANGVSVPLDEVARRAGVGAGTVHRHFPTKEALFEAIVVGNMERLTADARRHGRAADPGDAFFRFFGRLVEHGAKNRALTAALALGATDVPSVTATANQALFAAMSDLLTRAQHAGAVRPDIDARQVKAALIGVIAGSDWLGGRGRDRRHLVALICDGFRPPTGW